MAGCSLAQLRALIFSPANVDAFVEAMVKDAVVNDYDGINFDLELGTGTYTADTITNNKQQNPALARPSSLYLSRAPWPSLSAWGRQVFGLGVLVPTVIPRCWEPNCAGVAVLRLKL